MKFLWVTTDNPQFSSLTLLLLLLLQVNVSNLQNSQFPSTILGLCLSVEMDVIPVRITALMVMGIPQIFSSSRTSSLPTHESLLALPLSNTKQKQGFRNKCSSLLRWLLCGSIISLVTISDHIIISFCFLLYFAAC